METPHPAGSSPCLDAQHVAGASGQRGPFFPEGGTGPKMTGSQQLQRELALCQTATPFLHRMGLELGVMPTCLPSHT